ncbi:hypothetical protein LCGC14_1382500 [marine sediment metagenome]|uniref:KilA-N DNA-binding domain-containing protein n=1 Tax=marine sediment metagenome TaxID=412755 RepID=A0A0F9K2I2_9ZZZZ|nr:ORF6N domain-containing protein [Desulfobacterales bacterium]
MKKSVIAVPVKTIERSIFIIRAHKVMLDEDLATLYGVETRNLIQAVKRNIERFPHDFMFQLSKEEFVSLRSQIVISKGKGGRRYPPYAFTEQGVAMLSSVLKSDRAIHVNIQIMRAFTPTLQKLRMPYIQGLQGRSRSHLLRALGNEGDAVCSAFP